MPASSILLIAIGVLSMCLVLVHVLVRQHLNRQVRIHRAHRRMPTNVIAEEWLKPDAARGLTSASI